MAMDKSRLPKWHFSKLIRSAFQCRNPFPKLFIYSPGQYNYVAENLNFEIRITYVFHVALKYAKIAPEIYLLLLFHLLLRKTFSSSEF